MTVIQVCGSDKIIKTKAKQNSTSFHTFHQFCFTTKTYKTTKLESITPFKEEAAGIHPKHYLLLYLRRQPHEICPISTRFYKIKELQVYLPEF